MKKFLMILVAVLFASHANAGFFGREGRCDWVPANWRVSTTAAHSLLYKSVAAPAAVVGTGMVVGGASTALASSVIPIFGIPGVVGGAFIAKGGLKVWDSVNAFMKESNNDFICFGNGLTRCLQCDQHQTGDAFECGNGVIVATALGAAKCFHGGSDHWEKYKIPTCSNSPVPLSASGQKFVDIKSSTFKELDGVMIYGSDACFYVTCATGWHKDGSNCIEDKQPEKEDVPEYTPQPTNCKSTRTTKIGLACCDEKRSSYVAKADQCICWDKNKKFDIINGRGQCVDGGDTPDVPDVSITQTPYCNESTGARLNQNTNRCECATTELKLNADGVSCSCADSNKVYKNGKCEYSEEYLLLIKLKEIREVRARLDGIMNGFKVSVWKDAEGNFNTARLASDSVAGVVLGTVGGVVTSVVVKKNQLKKGFEAIQCAIGGQTVADYNDEFVVGPAR